MKKKIGNPTVFPCPVVLVTTVDAEGKANIITLAWAGQACSDPPCVTIAVRPQRYSHDLIRSSGEFVLNVPGRDILDAVDYCGVVSGRRVDKFKVAGLTPEAASEVTPPLIKECPVSLECRVIHTISLGVHDLFVGEIVAAHAEESVLTERGKVDYGRLAPFCYNPDEYWSLGEKIGTYGFMKKRELGD
ncbi:MAG: flavin reductase family protein [Actinobacteria bacterium]|nr:MAG: flavin reductase family protein [Actinomycetota bacterium]